MIKTYFLPMLVSLCAFSRGNAQLSGTVSEQSPVKVVGGGVADSTAFPWVVQLVGDDGAHICGASLIAPQWVITAGHCAQGMPGFIDPPTQVRINPYVTTNPLSSTETIDIDQIYLFPGYNIMNQSYQPDVALLHLATPAQTHEPVAVITDAADLSLTEAGDSCTVLGWGSTDANGTQSDTMKQGNMVIIDQNVAATAHAGNYLFDMDSTICAGYLAGTTPVGAGAGDSGGPLFVLKNQQPLLIGVVSGGEGVITTDTHPGIYTRLFTVRDWIDEVMNVAAGTNEFPEGAVSVYLGAGTLVINSKMQLNNDLQYSLIQLNGQVVQQGTCSAQIGKTIIALQQEPAPGVYMLLLESGPYRSRQKVAHF